MRINYIDNYDSFANTIAAYFRNAGAEVEIYKSDCDLETAVKGEPDMILLGPGPNSPKESGNYLEVLDKYCKRYPMFGICLGFQAMMEYFGQDVVPLENVVHGAAVGVQHTGKGIFEGIPHPAKFGRYNSLGVHAVPASFEISAASDGIVMAARHKDIPLEGVQFHPESVLSTYNESGARLIRNLIKMLKERKVM